MQDLNPLSATRTNRGIKRIQKCFATILLTDEVWREAADHPKPDISNVKHEKGMESVEFVCVEVVSDAINWSNICLCNSKKSVLLVKLVKVHFRMSPT